jgi:putative glutathione S-transferase
VSYACPWAHRILIARALKGLEGAISVTAVDARMGADGWVFSEEDPDPILGARFLREVYCAAHPQYTGRVTVPVLWDRQSATVVNNESREILRMLDHEFTDLATRDLDLAPPHLLERVERTIDAIYQPINNGVYRCGFARTQSAYDEAVATLFEALEHWDGVLAGQRFLCGDQLTEADICLFTTLARFDLVYYTHFKCNVRHIYEYEHLWRFAKENPKRIIPAGPARHLGDPGD